jgi:YHS domain-containing protein
MSDQDPTTHGAACPTCGATHEHTHNGDPARPAKTPLKTVKVRARGEDFRIVQLHGNLLVCSKAHGNCCCGWTEKGRAPVNTALYSEEWERRKIRNKVHLSFTGCLGPCAVGNNALLQIFGQSIWFKDLNGDQYVPMIYDYIESMLDAGHALPPPENLVDHVYARYLPPPTGDMLAIGGPAEEDGDGLERLDPVCLMDVDPATARWTSKYGGRTFYFCSPGCKKSFERNPQEYLEEVGLGESCGVDLKAG